MRVLTPLAIAKLAEPHGEGPGRGAVTGPLTTARIHASHPPSDIIHIAVVIARLEPSGWGEGLGTPA